jgi:peptidoglycan hydrolase CwlO-like protein
MTALTELASQIRRTEPQVWLSRIVLIKKPKPLTLIRDIPLLHRGLNIVWGIEEADEEGSPDLNVGHGVGKSTFCRLVRYCLGETTFGKTVVRDQIRQAFPSGYVGAELHVDGEPWAVVRPFGPGKLSYAKQSASVEDVLAEHPPRDSFLSFRDHLKNVCLAGISIPQDGDADAIQWEHLLAWCARDQEVRYQNLWEWRSARSDAEGLGIVRSKTIPILLMKRVLRLINDDEVAAKRRVEQLEHDIAQIDKQIDGRKREPEYWSSRLRSVLKCDYGIEEADKASFDPDDLFSLPKLVSRCDEQLSQRIAERGARIDKLDKEIAEVSAQINEATQFVDEYRAAAETIESGSEELGKVAVELEQRLESLKKAGNRFCVYGGVMVGQCSYVQGRVYELEGEIKAHRADVAPGIAERDQIAESIRETASRAEESLRRLRERQSELIAERNGIEQEIRQLERQSEGLQTTFDELAAHETILNGTSDDEELTTLRTRREELVQQQRAAEEKRRASLAQHTSQVKSVQQTFNLIVRAILSDKYTGEVNLTEDDVSFSIRHKASLGGEGVDTLTILLADLTAMIAGATGVAFHPGFVIHDSPREADLGPRLYRWYLKSLAELHQRLSSAAEAPFQYIVTTTTPPPDGLQSDKWTPVKLRHVPNEFLFRMDLNEPPPPDEDGQPTLPGFDDHSWT